MTIFTISFPGIKNRDADKCKPLFLIPSNVYCFILHLIVCMFQADSVIAMNVGELSRVLCCVGNSLYMEEEI